MGMTDPEREAFRRGFLYGVENCIDAHDGLLTLAARFVAEMSLIGASDEMLVADQEVLLVMAKVRELREGGADDALVLFGLERA